MKRTSQLITAIFLTAVFASCSKDNNDNTLTLNSTDQTFMTNAAYANNDEINFAQLALTQSSNDSVKAFAQKIITDHTNAGASLDSIATKYNVTLPTSIDSIHSVLKTQLQGYSGNQFDTAYIHGQIKDHTTAITLFQNEASNGTNLNVKNFASTNLPALQMHLQMADSLSAHLP